MTLKRILFFIFLILLMTFTWILYESIQSLDAARPDRLDEPTRSSFLNRFESQISVAKDPLMGPMTNATLKAELGRSAWRLLHVYVS